MEYKAMELDLLEAIDLWLCRMLARSAYHIPTVSFTNLGVLDDDKLKCK